MNHKEFEEELNDLIEDKICEIMEDEIERALNMGKFFGKLLGGLEAKETMALRLLKQGMPIKKISDITEFSCKEIRYLSRDNNNNVSQ